MIICATTDHVN